MRSRSPSPPILSQLVGPQRARVMRRRAGWAALGLGLVLLRPRSRWSPTRRVRGGLVSLGLATAVVTAAFAAGVMPAVVVGVVVGVMAGVMAGLVVGLR